eukprot:1146583-Pelagomonas_calceolata.AAC.6
MLGCRPVVGGVFTEAFSSCLHSAGLTRLHDYPAKPAVLACNGRLARVCYVENYSDHCLKYGSGTGKHTE